MAIVHNLASTSCPLPVGYSSLSLVSDAYDTGGNVYNGETLSSGVASSLSNKFNSNAKRLDLDTLVGSPAYAVLTGLQFQNPSGIAIEVSAGQATVGSLVELAEDTTLVLADGFTNRVWLKRDGTLVARTDTTIETDACFLGSVVVAAGAISTNYDHSGRFQHAGGIVTRRTNDVGVPADTPTVKWVFITKTQGGEFLWTGNAYTRLIDPTPINIAGSRANTEQALKNVIDALVLKGIITDSTTA